jgi:hypothetical protein
MAARARSALGLTLSGSTARVRIRRITAVRLPTRYLTPATERFLALLATAAHNYDAGAQL